jgi:hypothetical protein
MSSHLRALTALAALVGALLAAPLAAAQADTDSAERDAVRGFYAGFVEAREIDSRCGLLEPERRVKFADYLEYLRQDTVRDFGAEIIPEAEDVGKRYARDPEYLDCGQAAMDRIENRYERIEMLVNMDKWKRETPEGREFAEKMARIQEEVAAETAAEEAAAEPETPAPTETEQKEAYLAMLGFHAHIVRTETRCSFLDEAMHTRFLALQERAARSLRDMIADPAAVAAVESAHDAKTGCGDDLSQLVRGLAENIDETEAMVEMMEKIDAMVTDMKRRQEAAAATDLLVPLPPPPADRPRPLTKAQKRKAENLEHYARSLRTQRSETRCRFLPEETRVRLLRTEARYAELLRLEIGDPAAVAEVDAAAVTDTLCRESQRTDVVRAVNFIGLTEDIIKMMESTRTDESP